MSVLIDHPWKRAPLVVMMIVTCLSAVAVDAGEAASMTSIKLLLSSQIGWYVDMTTRGQVCTTASEDVCMPGIRSSRPGGFRYLTSVAASRTTGNVYVSDSINSRIQEITAAGVFVATFGWDVNKTKDKRATATRAERNVCTASSRDVCVAGVKGAEGGQFTYPGSITVDPVTNDIYVVESDVGQARIDKYTADGRFLWTIGKDVNKATGRDICTAQELEKQSVKCGAGVESGRGSGEHGAFKILARNGDELAAGGPEDLLYVGDEGRVQEFDSNGRWRREIATISPARVSVAGIAIDKAGDLYVVTQAYELGFVANVIHKFNQAGEQTAEFVIGAKRPNATVTIHGLAIDAEGRLALIGGEEGLLPSEEPGSYIETYMLLGALYDGENGRFISEFMVPIGNDGLTFNEEDELYVAATDGQEILRYTPTPVASLVTSPISCQSGGEDETSVAFECLPRQ